MAYVNGNKPIVTDGLIYALDFGNSRCYTSGSTQATSLAYDRATTSISGSPAFNNNLLDFTSTKFIKRDGSLPALDPNGTFTVMFAGNAVSSSGTFLRQDTLNSTIDPTSSLFGFGLDGGDFSRSYPGFTSSSLQHVTYRYSEGTIDTFINGIPVTASVANTSLTNTAVSNALFIGSGSAGFSGSLAQFYVYNRALSADEIYTTYLVSAERNGLPAVPKPYTLDENVYKYVQTTGITDNDTISAIDTFVSGLKSNGLWNKMTAIYPFLTTSTGSQAVNLKDPGVLATSYEGSWTGSSTGVSPVNSTSYLTPSNIAPVYGYPNLTTESIHISYLSYDSPQTSSYIAGLQLPAIGGDLIVTSGSKVYHAFLTTGTSSFKMIDPTVTEVEVMVVGGGGAGGGSNGNESEGGGGAGGLVYSSSFTVTPNTSILTVVGNGGQSNGADGENSNFGTIIAFGGGGGANSSIGRPGGSGGGGSSRQGSAAFAGGLGTPGQGNDGGSGSYQGPSPANTGGGGGGAGEPGHSASFSGGGPNGGSGSYFPQYTGLGLGSPLGWFAGGGGGAAQRNVTGLGGPGGGGQGQVGTNGFLSSGEPNTGGGGGGLYNYSAQADIAGKGGSGIIIVSYSASAIKDTLPSTAIKLTEDTISGSANNAGPSGITGSATIGFLTLSRTGSSGYSLHKNTNKVNIVAAASQSANVPIVLNGISNAGEPQALSPYKISYASIGAGLTDSEVSTYYNLVSQFQTNLKRQNTLLDNYSGAAAAYSLRRIGPSGYFGPAIRVRRDSDNALRDIGFTSDGQLDTVGLLDFVGVTGSGFVQTWYDQSRNGYNATQATTTSQPYIILSGSLIYSENRVGVRNEQNQGLRTLSFPSYDYLSFYNLVKPVAQDGIAVYQGYTGIGIGSYKLFFGYNSGLTTRPEVVFFNKQGANRNTTISMSNNVRKLITADGNPDNLQLSLDGTLVSTQNFTGPMGGATIIGIGNGYGTYPSIHQEVILYTSSRRDISDNVNSNILSAYTTGSDPDYQAFITATGITEPTQSAALETLVSDLKSYGLWNKMKAIYPMVTDRNNRFAQSENFDLTWNTVSASVSPNQTTAPNGTTTADLILDTVDNNEHYIYQTIDDGGLVTGSEYVISAYAKFYNTPYIAFKTNTGAQAWFDVQTGVTGSYTGSNATITNVGNGWYRCALYFTSSVTTGPYNQHIHLARTDNDLTFTGTGDSGSYLWGAQFENGNLLGPYRKTEGSGFTTGSMFDQMKYNLVNPVDSDAAFRLTYNGNWNPGYSGVKPDGSTAYASPHGAENARSTTWGIAFGYYNRTNDIFNNPIRFGSMGIENGSRWLAIEFYNGSAFYKIGQTGALVTKNVSSNIKGLHIVTRKDATEMKAFLRGTLLGTNTNNPGDFLPSGFTFAARNGINHMTHEHALGFISEGLTDYEAKALYWIVQKYQTTLGRQVY